MDNSAWHQRFVLQTLWTKSLRAYLYKQIKLDHHARILDLGSGTGALLSENLDTTPFTYGIDFNHSRNVYAKLDNPTAHLSTANAYDLPFSKNQFDFTFCHYLLLWIEHPIKVLKEIYRVTRSGGVAMAFAEPDYQARIDYPATFQIVGKYQNQSLAKQGVQLDVGRRLKRLFTEAGFCDVTMGMLSGEWQHNTREQFELEWEIITYDLKSVLPMNEIKHLKENAYQEWMNASGYSFIPTFYAYGKVPS